jgi:Fe-S oxidoreductase
MLATQEALNQFVEETGGWIASQLEACTRCGMCTEACHFYISSGNPAYSPVWKMELLRRAYEGRFTLSGRLKLALGIEKPITQADLETWRTIDYEACTLCNRCSLVCPMGIDLGSLIHGVRGALAAAGEVPDDLEQATQKQIEDGSPLGVDLDTWRDRMDWIQDEWEVELPIDVQGADTMAVFTSIELMKFPSNIAYIAKIMQAAGESWTISSKGREVVNFGLFEGNTEHTVLFLKRVFDAATELGVKRVMVTECGHAYEALRWTSFNLMDVPEGLEVTHIAGVLGEFIEQGRIKLKSGAMDDGTITFHDACKIQRKGGHIREPRMILNILAPDTFVEMTPNREEGICCGAGGGVISIGEADQKRYDAFELKIDQMNQIGAKRVAMLCSNCRLQFVDCVQHFGLDWKVYGISQMVAESLADDGNAGGSAEA